ncbi:MAG: DUF99 family protein [Candidatus Methanomethylicia archaeon]
MRKYQNYSYKYIIAFDDGKLPKNKDGKTILMGVKTNKTILEEVFLREIEVDGLDATEKALEIIREANPIDVILLNGISYGGFNLMDVKRIWEETRIPIIIYTKMKPDNKSVISALMKHFQDWRERWEIIKNVLKISNGIHQIKIKEKEKPVYIEVIGISVEEATRILRENTIWGRTPEPIRIVEIMAEEISKTYLQVKNK